MDLTARLTATVARLCSPGYLPRLPGSRGGLAAGRYLEERLTDLGLQPLGDEGFRQVIAPHRGANLLASIPGSGDRYVMLAAHYDAAGWDNPGADDNAAGVAITLEVAARLRGLEPQRSVVIALFDAEEPPFYLTPEMGSQWFVDHPTLPLDRLDTMVCLDLVGHAVGPPELPSDIRNAVFVLGAEKSTGTGALFDATPPVPGINPVRVDSYVIPPLSDYYAFMNAGIPFLFYSCGRWQHYHAPTDTPDKLDYDKMAAFAEHLTTVVATLANRQDVPVYEEDGFDDAATVASLQTAMGGLVPLSDLAADAAVLLDVMAEKVESAGSLDLDERRLITQLIATVEMALA